MSIYGCYMIYNPKTSLISQPSPNFTFDWIKPHPFEFGLNKPHPQTFGRKARTETLKVGAPNNQSGLDKAN